MKILVVGLDGATWNLIRSWADNNILSTFKWLMENGCWGYLESSIPPVTFPAWKCYSTGKNPGKLGVYWWAHPDFKNKNLRVNDSRSFRSWELWDYLGKVGKICGVLGMPTTYPPKRINGFMVSEFNPSNSGFTYPSQIESELKELGFNGEFMDYHGKTKKEVFDYCLKSIKERFTAAKYLIEKYNPDFMHLTIFHIDAIQHFFWEDMVNNDPDFGDAIERAWKLIDSEIKRLLDMFDFDYVFLVSDHGFTQLKAMFNIYQWAIRMGYMRLNSKLVYLLNKFGILGISSIIMKKLLRIIPAKEDKKNFIRNASLSLIDWDNSAIIPLAEGVIYVNPSLKERMDFMEYLEFLDSLISELNNLVDKKTNKKLVSKIYKRNELYSGEYLDLAPDVVVLPNDGYEITTSFMYNQIWNYKPKEKGWSAIHAPYGIFLAYGKGIKKGVNIVGTKIYDIAPTILHIFNLPIPDDIDGKIIMDIFESDSEFVKRKPVYVNLDWYIKKERENIKSRIRNLKSKKKL